MYVYVHVYPHMLINPHLCSGRVIIIILSVLFLPGHEEVNSLIMHIFNTIVISSFVFHCNFIVLKSCLLYNHEQERLKGHDDQCCILEC